MELNPKTYIVDYVYPIFRVETKEDLVYYMSLGSIIYGICTFITPIDFPYGKHAAKWAGFDVPVKFAWFVQELPSFVIPLMLVIWEANGEYLRSIFNKVFIGMFLIHYFQRTFIYVMLMTSNKPSPFLPFICAFFTTAYNGILHGYYFTCCYSYDDEDCLSRQSFWIGCILYCVGMAINIHSDSILRSLKKGESKEYKIPRGGLFEYVSCANYFGEILEMCGYAIASRAPPAFAFAFFVVCFLTRKGIQSHRWYKKKFENYPKNRKAVIPFLV